MDKKTLLKFLFVICIMGSFVGCSDDEPATSPNEITNDYTDEPSDEEGAKLTLTYSGNALIGKSVKFETTDAKTAKITLKGVLPHEAETVIDNIALADDGNKGYNFSGDETSTLGTTFSYNGTVRKGTLSLDILNVKIPDSSFNTLALVTYSNSETKTETIDGKKHRYSTFQQSLYLNTESSGINSLETLLSNVILGPFLKSVVKNITFNPDGNITAMYAPLPETFDFQRDIIQNGGINRTDTDWKASPINLVTYFIANTTELYLTPNIDMISRQIQQDATVRSTETQPSGIAEALAQIKKWMSTGIKLTIKENPKKEFYIYKESATMVQHRKYEGEYVVYIDKEEIKVFIPLIKSLMPALLTPEVLEKIDQSTGGMITEDTINTLLEAVESAETLEIGLFLNKINH